MCGGDCCALQTSQPNNTLQVTASSSAAAAPAPASTQTNHQTNHQSNQTQPAKVRWVEEFRVDGFRFDLASCLCRDDKGRALPAPPLIREIARHPVLSRVHLIAEPWDLGMYQVGGFPHWDVWAEWNGRYRDDVRRFIKGDAGEFV